MCKNTNILPYLISFLNIGYSFTQNRKSNMPVVVDSAT